MIRMRKSSMEKNGEQHKLARCSSRHRFKYQILMVDDLFEDLLKALNNFKTVMEFQNEVFNEDKPRQNNTSFPLIFSDIGSR